MVAAGARVVAVNLVTIFGPAAAGKATVGRELAAITGYRLLHNNMALDLVAQFFPRGTPGFALYPEFNTRIIETAANHGSPNLIFTVVWALDREDDWELEMRRHRAVEEAGGRNFYVELTASQGERIRRNALPDRRASKPQTATLTAEIMLEMEGTFRLNSADDFPLRPYLRVDTEACAPREAAMRIAEAFGLLG